MPRTRETEPGDAALTRELLWHLADDEAAAAEIYAIVESFLDSPDQAVRTTKRILTEFIEGGLVQAYWYHPHTRPTTGRKSRIGQRSNSWKIRPPGKEMRASKESQSFASGRRLSALRRRSDG
jgi:hypothetical protein